MDIRQREESMDDVDVEFEDIYDFSMDSDYQDSELNLERLKETNRILSSGTEVTDEWRQEHCKHILYYVWAVSKSNPAKESDSPDYQKLVHELIVLLDDLKQSIVKTGTFSLPRYRSAVARLLKVIQEATSMYELDDAMNGLLT
jgi:hypothetical protein